MVGNQSETHPTFSLNCSIAYIQTKKHTSSFRKSKMLRALSLTKTHYSFGSHLGFSGDTPMRLQAPWRALAFSEKTLDGTLSARIVEHASVSLLNKFDVRSVFHGKRNLVAVNQIYVIHEAMNGCKNLNILQRLASKILIHQLTPFSPVMVIVDCSSRLLMFFCRLYRKQYGARSDLEHV